MPTVARFNVTPMKGTALQHPERVQLEAYGVPGNRAFFLVDPAGKRISATRFGSLIPVHADHDGDNDLLTLSFPDGTTVSGPAAPGPEELVTDMWGRDVSCHVVEGDFAAVLSAYLDEPVRLVRCDRDGDGNDEQAVTIVSLESVAELASHGGHDGPLDAGRFRMTIELEGCAPHQEDTWVGKDVRVGDAVLRVDEPVPRCIVTTRSPTSGERDFDTLKVIASYRERTPDGLPFGIYATVTQPGAVALGDPILLG
ncbi:MAG: MOSC domain-containing protein [Actinomycetota bacterium]